MPNVLLLKAVPSDGLTGKGYDKPFAWPDSGPVECSDWSPKAECGGGLHAWIWSQSPTLEGCLLQEGMTLRVVEVDEADIVDLYGKVKFRKGVVLGSYASVQEAVITHGLQSRPDLAGYAGAATAGNRGAATAGYAGAATAGLWGAATAGELGIARAGFGGLAKGGKGSVLAIEGRTGKEDDWTYRCYCAVVGFTKGVKADLWYSLDAKNRFVETEAPAPLSAGHEAKDAGKEAATAGKGAGRG